MSQEVFSLCWFVSKAFLLNQKISLLQYSYIIVRYAIFMNKTSPVFMVLMITAFSFTGCIGNDLAHDDDSDQLSIFIFEASETIWK